MRASSGSAARAVTWRPASSAIPRSTSRRSWTSASSSKCGAPATITRSDAAACHADQRSDAWAPRDEIRMKKWNMIVDVAECTNCNLCTLSTMDEYVGNDWPGYTKPMPRHGHRWINILQKERGQVPMIDIAYVPTMCNHCDAPPCMANAGDAIKKRPDGIVLIDPRAAKGRRDLVDACPYGHIWWNEEHQVPQLWPFDAHLIDQGWQQTRGQQACPTGA